ncbi:UDP-N-acetylmuramate dehydrogenase, partial [Alkalibaculum bacchi]|uniref:UDP-N-acetylmuramate dehydrogenase n=1 Tax=Alkalibaculum bacchi TaxID=645887 RepID=UPI0026EB5675
MIKYILSKLETFLDKKSLLINEPMKNHTSFKVGGPVDLMILPKTEDEVVNVLKLLASQPVPFYIMGNGSNLLVSDRGFSGVVIKLYDNYNDFSVNEDIITAKSGILLSKLAKVSLNHNLGGFEFASGIPGTLGGAVTMNAGAYGGEMKDVLISAHVVDRQGNISEIVNGHLELGYRTSSIQKKDLIVLSAKLQLKKAPYDDIKDKMNELDYKRKDKQPLEWPSAGSTFKRPEGHFAGKLIQDCGLRGYSIGGAQISEKHCGFVINKGGATASDIFNLIRHVQETVYEKFG